MEKCNYKITTLGLDHLKAGQLTAEVYKAVVSTNVDCAGLDIYKYQKLHRTIDITKIDAGSQSFGRSLLNRPQAMEIAGFDVIEVVYREGNEPVYYLIANVHDLVLKRDPVIDPNSGNPVPPHITLAVCPNWETADSLANRLSHQLNERGFPRMQFANVLEIKTIGKVHFQSRPMKAPADLI